MEKSEANIDISRTLSAWCATHEPRWHAQRIASRVRPIKKPGVDKFVVTLRTMMHEATLAVWSVGTVEFTVLDYSRKREAASRSGRYVTELDLQRFLDGCVAEFEGMIRATC